MYRSRGEIRRNITPDYYGYRDEEDGVLLIKEAEAEVIIAPHLFNARLTQ